MVQARLISHLRRVGLSLDDIRTVLTEPADAARILATHLGRLEAGLVDVRREISIVHQLLEATEITMTRCTLPAAELIRALSGVRYAISSDPNRANAERGLPGQRARPVASGCDRSWLEIGRRQIPVDAATLRAALDAGTPESLTRDNDGVAFQVSRLNVTTSGVEVGASEDPDAMVIGVNREFLLQALEAGDQLTLGLDGPIAPLAIRDPEQAGALSILMPFRLDQPA